MQLRNVTEGNIAEVSKLAVMLLCDGSVRYDRVCFVSKDTALLNYFSNLVELFGYAVKKHKKPRATELRVNSTKFVKELWEFTPTYRTKPCNNYPPCSSKSCKECLPLIYNGEKYPPARLPQFIEKLSNKEQIEVLRLIFSMEGGVTISIVWDRGYLRVARKVFLACKHPTLRKAFTKLLEHQGFLPKYDSQSKSLEFRDNYQIVRFEEKIGFLPEVTVTSSCSKWYGIEKNKLLKSVVDLIDKPKGFLCNFSTKEEFIDYIKSAAF